MAIRRLVSTPLTANNSIPTIILIVMIAFVFGAVAMFIMGKSLPSEPTAPLKASPAPPKQREPNMIVIKNEAIGATEDDNPFIYEDAGNLRRPPARPFYYPSRGLAQPYQQFGILIGTERRNTGEQTILPLIGRQVYPGASRYHYYTSTNGYHPMKLPISHRNRTCNDMTGCEEIYSGNVVSVPGYDYDFKADIYPSPDFNYIQ
jgi:hypothetical protein